jgi:DNA primase
MTERRIFKEIDRSLMDDVRKRLNLAAVVAEHVELTAVVEGAWYTGLCPFCLPGGQLTVSVWDSDPLRSYYLCRACEARGSVVGFTMRIANIGFRDALLKLCDQADIAFVENDVERAIPTQAKIVEDIARLDILREPHGEFRKDVSVEDAMRRADAIRARMMAQSRPAP